MKILHITTSSRGGAGIAALRLHEALCQNGVTSAYLSINLTIDFDNKIVEDSFFQYDSPTFFNKIVNKISTVFSISERKRIEKEFKKLESKMQCEIATLPFSYYKVHKHPLFIDADIINLHWIDGIIDYESFFKNCEKPIVWTLHDMNPFLGIFHYINDEVINAEISASLNSRIKEIKRSAIKNVQKGVCVTPSEWLLTEVVKSDVFSAFEKISILNSIDFQVFKIQDKEVLRKEYAISENEFVVLFVSDFLSNPRKGFDLLLESLNFLKDNDITILTIGKGTVPVVDNLKIISLGEITTPSKMAEFYALADVFVLPSREDNLPNVMLESFACGTPMAGFAIGGIAEHVINDFTGVLAKEVNGFSLAEAILNVKKNKEGYKSEMIREYAETNFSYKQQADSYIKIFRSLLSK